MFTAILIAASFGQSDYNLGLPAHDYAFVALRSEQRNVIAHAAKATAITPVKCVGGMCVRTARPLVTATKSVLVKREVERKRTTVRARRTTWLGRFFRR